MDYNCKVCLHTITTTITDRGGDKQCKMCLSYYIRLNIAGNITHEWLIPNNREVMLLYRTQTKKAFLFLDRWSNNPSIDVSPIEELTFEIVAEWMKRLKTYLVFQ